MLLDHVYLFVRDILAAERLGASLGLVETYRRKHKGQGTENICYCFENAFLELLVMVDEAEATSPPIMRTGLYERARWHELGTCPIGISWRLQSDDETEPFETWSFRPPYLPNNMDIRVAVDGDNPTQPMMFRSPGKTPPIEWQSERRGDLQSANRLKKISSVILTHPNQFRPGRCLSTLVGEIPVELRRGTGSDWNITIVAETMDGWDHPLVIV